MKKIILFLAFLVQISVWSQAPNISYATPQVYGVGTPISSLTPLNSGGAVPAVIYGQVSTFAGSGTQGSADATGTSASFNTPYGLTIDPSGNLFVADYGNAIIRKITSSGVVTTFAGHAFGQGSINGTGSVATFCYPKGVASDASGNIYVADYCNNLIRKITSSGSVSTFAGSGSGGSADGTGTGSTFYYPSGAVVDPSGNIYIADQNYDLIRKITPGGVVTTFAGGGGGAGGSNDGTGTAARFANPIALACDTSGNIYVADSYNNKIRKITSTGVVTTFAGSTTQGSSDGVGTAATFYHPYGIAVDALGNVYVSDTNNSRIRMITPAGVVTTLAGSSYGSNDATGTLASFSSPYGLAINPSGYLFVSDFNNNKIRKINLVGYTISPSLPAGLNFDATTGIISGTPTAVSSLTSYTITAYNTSGSSIATVAFATCASVTLPSFTAVSPICAGGSLSALPTTSNNNITGTWSPALSNTVTTTYTFTPTAGQCATTTTMIVTVNTTPPPTGLSPQIFVNSGTIANLTLSGTTIKWYTSSTAGSLLSNTTSLVDGTIYYASQTNLTCESTTRLPVITRKISEATQNFCNNATVSNLVSNPSTGTTANWYTTATGGNALASTDVLATGIYYVDQTIPASTTSFDPHVIGRGWGNISGIGIAVQADGKIWWTNPQNHAVERMDTFGTYAGFTLGSWSFSAPEGIAVEADGKILVTDVLYRSVYRINADGTNIVTVFNGVGSNGIAVQANGKILLTDWSNNAIKRIDYDGTNIVTLATGFNHPYMVAVQADGKILVTDYDNNAVKRMDADGSNIVTLGSGFSHPTGITVQADGSILVSDNGNRCLKKMNADGTNIITLCSGIYPLGIALQADGTILVINGYSVTKIISPATYSNRVAVSVAANTTAAPIGSAQSFCNSATVASLVATGTDLKWYASATGGAVLNTSTALSSGTYYVTQTLNSCESTSRTAIGVTVNVTPSATASSQIFCNATTVASLVASGTALKWYTSATGGTELNTATALASGTYYVTQTLNACESATRTTVPVTVSITSAATASAQIFYKATSVSSLVATGTAIKWYTSSTGGTALNTATALATGTYYVTQTLNTCESTTRTAVAVTVNITPIPTASAQTLYTGSTVANLVAIGANLQWYTNLIDVTALATDTVLTTGTYYVSQTVNGIESVRISVAVTIISPYTNIPDTNFEQALIDLGYDDIIDHQVLTANISIVTSLDVNTKSISDLTGILGFSNLITLDCSYNQLIDLNVSGLKNLNSLNCQSNKLTNLNVSGLTSLETLFCNVNQLTNLNISELTSLVNLSCNANKLTSINFTGLNNLTNLECNYNLITSLNLRGLTNIIYFRCFSNQLTGLDIRNITNIRVFDASNNPNLSCILVDNPTTASAAVNWTKDDTAYYSTSCGLTTQLTASQRGTTLSALYATITADSVANATVYRFEVTNGATVRTFDSLINTFNLSQLSGEGSYITTYAIRVQTHEYNSSIWSDYGKSYNITTPNIPVISLQSNQCGVTLATLATVLTADAVIGASSYRFEVSVSGSVVETYVSTTNSFNLTQLTAGAAYATAYAIRPAAQVNGVWGAYGSPCTVTTGANAPPLTTVTTSLVNSVCGVSLTSIYSPLYANAVKSATSYRFEATTGSVLQTYTTSSNVFNLTQLPQGVIYGTTYSIRVAYLLNGTWYDYGRSCNVTTPALMTTQLVASRCGATITSFYAPLYANTISGATGYRFEVTNGATTRTYDSSTNVFNLMQLRLGAAYNTTYSIRVAVQYAGTWQGFGTSCTVTTPSIATTQLVASRCGATVTSLYAPLYANAVSLATGYRFEVSTGGSILGFYDAVTNVFNLKQVAGTAKNTAYSIRVAVLFNGTYQSFGSSCTVTTALNANTRMSDGDLEATVFTAKAFPNPFATSFNLAIESSSDDQVEVKVYDMIGRELEARKATVSEWSTQELGNGYPQGVYNVIVTQGDQVKTLRMVKR